MADQLQLRRGTTSENSSFTGADGEVVVDTDKRRIIVHDGSTAGGFPQASAEMVNNGVIFFDDNTSGGSAADAYLLAARDNTLLPEQYNDGQYFGFITDNSNTGSCTASFSGLGVKSIKMVDGSNPPAGEIDDRVVLLYDGDNDWFVLQKFQPFDADVAKLNQDQEYTKRQRSNVLDIAYSASITIDQSGPSISQIELAGNPTINAFSNPEDGAQWEVRFIQDATGSREPSFDSSFKNAPTSWTATAEAIDIIYGETVYNTDTSSYIHYVLGSAMNVDA